MLSVGDEELEIWVIFYNYFIYSVNKYVDLYSVY